MFSVRWDVRGVRRSVRSVSAGSLSTVRMSARFAPRRQRCASLEQCKEGVYRNYGVLVYPVRVELGVEGGCVGHVEAAPPVPHARPLSTASATASRGAEAAPENKPRCGGEKRVTRRTVWPNRATARTKAIHRDIITSPRPSVPYKV